MIKNREIINQDIQDIISTDLPWQSFANKTVLVAGANGFLPAYMIETFLYLNQTQNLQTKIIALARNQQKLLARFADVNDPYLQFHIQDVSDEINISEKIDFIIHAASQASPKYYGSDPVGTLSANVLGTKNLLELAKKNNVSGFLFFSSGEVYGQAINLMGDAIAEEHYGYLDPTQVRSCYAEGKRMGETMCVAWSHQYCIPVKIIRPFHTYGPGMAFDDGRVFADLTANVVKSEPIVLNSDGSATRAFCYISDAIKGYFTVLLKGDNASPYNIGNPHCDISILDLAKLLITLFPEKKLTVTHQPNRNQGYLKSKTMNLKPDITKAIALGWQPTTSLADGFLRTIQSYT